MTDLEFRLIDFSQTMFNILKDKINPNMKVDFNIEYNNTKMSSIKENVIVVGSERNHKNVILFLDKIIDIGYNDDSYEEDIKELICKYYIIQNLIHELHHTLQSFNYAKYENKEYIIKSENACERKSLEFIINNKEDLEEMGFNTDILKKINTILYPEYDESFIYFKEDLAVFYYSKIYDAIISYYVAKYNKAKESAGYNMDKILSDYENQCDKSLDSLGDLLSNNDNIKFIFNNIEVDIKSKGEFIYNIDNINKMNIIDEIQELSHTIKIILNNISLDINNYEDTLYINIIIDYKIKGISRNVIERVDINEIK